MNPLRNQITIIGDLRREAEITTFESGAMVARFGISSAKRKQKTGDNPAYRLFAWGGVASFIHQHCGKGSRLAITGRLVNRTYVGKDGTPCKVTEVEVRQVVKL